MIFLKIFRVYFLDIRKYFVSPHFLCHKTPHISQKMMGCMRKREESCFFFLFSFLIQRGRELVSSIESKKIIHCRKGSMLFF